MFRTHTATPSLELSVTVYNVNAGHNKALLDASKTLKGYSIFVSKAIDECVQENVLKDFFLTYRQEVINMSYSESTAEEQIEIISNFQYQNGFSNGQKNINELYAWLLSNNRSEDINKAIQDPEYLAKLQEEYKSLVAAN